MRGPTIHQLIARLGGIIGACIFLGTSFVSAHSRQIDNRFIPPSRENPGYNRKFEDLETQVGSIGHRTEIHGDDFKLAHSTVLECRDYLSLLFDHINSTREDHLPELQQMFEAVTRREAMTDPQFVIGNPAYPTNFYFLNQAIDKNSVDLKNAEHRISSAEDQIKALGSLLKDREQLVETLNMTLEQINNTLAEKFLEFDKVLEDYNSRVQSIEQRMVSVEARVGEVQRNLDGFESRIKALEEIFDEKKIKEIDELLKITSSNQIKHSGFITELQTNLSLAQGEASALREELTVTQQDLTRSVNELRQRIQEIEQ